MRTRCSSLFLIHSVWLRTWCISTRLHLHPVPNSVSSVRWMCEQDKKVRMQKKGRNVKVIKFTCTVQGKLCRSSSSHHHSDTSSRAPHSFNGKRPPDDTKHVSFPFNIVHSSPWAKNKVCLVTSWIISVVSYKCDEPVITSATGTRWLCTKYPQIMNDWSLQDSYI